MKKNIIELKHKDLTNKNGLGRVSVFFCVNPWPLIYVIKKEAIMLKSKISKCLLIMLCLFVTGNVFALTWDELKVKIEKKYAGFSDEVKDMEILMKTESKEMKEMVPSEIKTFKKGDKLRIETKMNMPEGAGMPAEMGGMTNIIIFDGTDLWMINTFTGKQKLPSDTYAGTKDQLNWWEDLPEKGEIVGSEKIGDRDCYIVETWNEKDKDDKIKGWVEKNTLLLIKMESKSSKDKTFTVINSNFQKVKEWELPYTTEVFTNGDLMTKTTIISFDINKGLSDDLFDADKVSVDTKKPTGMPNMMENMMKNFKPEE
jgi:outer membrane lipoprotein-sorting protein